MSAPLFIHVYSNGDLWASNDINFTPSATQEAGTLVGTYRLNSDLASQKIGVLGGTVSSSLTATKTTGKNGSEIK